MSNPQDKCPRCDGSGVLADTTALFGLRPCRNCDGTGVVDADSDTSDRAKASPRASWHISGTNTDTTLDDVLKKALRTGSEKGGYSYDLIKFGELKQALTTRLKEVELEARIDEQTKTSGDHNMSLLEHNTPLLTQDGCSYNLNRRIELQAELQAHHNKDSGLAHDKLSVRSEPNTKEEDA